MLIYYICCTNDAILLYENIFFDGKKVFTAGSCLQPAVLMSPSPTVPDTNRRWWVHITNGSGTGGDGPAITNDLNPTVPKTVGDVLLEPAVIGVAVVVIESHMRRTRDHRRPCPCTFASFFRRGQLQEGCRTCMRLARYIEKKENKREKPSFRCWQYYLEDKNKKKAIMQAEMVGLNFIP